MNPKRPSVFSLIKLAMVTVPIGISCMLSPSVAKAQNSPVYLPYQGDLLSANGPITLPIGTTSAPGITNLSGQRVILLHSRTSISFFPNIAGVGAASVSNVVFQLAVSPWVQTNRGAYTTNLVINNGTTLFCTTSPTGLQVTTTLQGTTNVVGFQTLNWTNWDGSIAMELYGINNYATNVVTPVVSNLWYSFQATQP